MCLIVCPLVFLAGFIDSVAGGGGLISIPAFLISGLPTHFAVGTNKFVAGIGSLVATGKYLKSGKVILRVALFGALGALLGAFCGTSLALHISENVLRIIIVAVLPFVALFLLLKKNLGDDGAQAKNFSPPVLSAISFAIGFFIGVYDGLVGPGTGTFLILASIF
jgi:uncharacterized membrane protein YfcA